MSALAAPDVVAIDDLELAARLVVEGMQTGAHRSPFHGFAASFSQHRPYRPGDDLKHLDWKVLARTDRLYTRQFSQTTNLAAMIVLDASASMAYPTDTGSASKFRYAVRLAAALAYLIVRQGDAAGLVARDRGRWVYVPARRGRAHLAALLASLARIEPAEDAPVAASMVRAADLLKRRGVIVTLSDFYEADDGFFREVRRLSRRGHDLALLHVLSRNEIAFPYATDLEFADLETGARRHLDAGQAARAYRSRIAAFLAECRRGALRDGHDYAMFLTDVPPSQALRAYLIHRAESSRTIGRAAATRR